MLLKTTAHLGETTMKNPLTVTYHKKPELVDGCLILSDPAMDMIGLSDHSVSLVIPNRASVNMDSWMLRDSATVPEAISDTVEHYAQLERHENGSTLFLSHPILEEWLDCSNGFYIAYSNIGMRIVRIKEDNAGPCAKQNVLATLISDGGEVFVGTNLCLNPQQECPRDKYGMKSGEGYHLCEDICQQRSHAEVDAITKAGEKARGGIIYLTGHQYACANCSSCAEQASVKTINVRNERLG